MNKAKINQAKDRLAISRYWVNWDHYAKNNKATADAIDDFIRILDDLKCLTE
jgi:hypothetical protein